MKARNRNTQETKNNEIQRPERNKKIPPHVSLVGGGQRPSMDICYQHEQASTK